MTNIDQFYHKECEKIDPSCVNAFLALSLDDFDPSVLVLDHSWGTERLDLEPAVKDAETVTHLTLGPTYLNFMNEHLEDEVIEGDDLSHIISMTLLKDVDQTQAIGDGKVFIYDASTGKFKPYDLAGTIANINQQLINLGDQITAVSNRVTNLETILTKPEGVPSDATVAWGNRNTYFDHNNTESKAHGIYTHNPNNNLTDDTYFA